MGGRERLELIFRHMKATTIRIPLQLPPVARGACKTFVHGEVKQKPLEAFIVAYFNNKNVFI